MASIATRHEGTPNDRKAKWKQARAALTVLESAIDNGIDNATTLDDIKPLLKIMCRIFIWLIKYLKRDVVSDD
jgi:hypothetical protein